MTAKQIALAEALALGLNIKEAAEVAGCSYSSAKRYKSDPAFKAHCEALAAGANKDAMGVSWVENKLREIVDRCMTPKPALSSKTGKPIRDNEGNLQWTFQSAAALKALELLGKLKHVAAFDKDRADVNINFEDAYKTLNEGRDNKSIYELDLERPIPTTPTTKH